MSSDILKLLQAHEPGGLNGCYTCSHPIARDLVLKLIKALSEEQAEGRMLFYSKQALFDVVVGQCKSEGKPYLRQIKHFKAHLKKDTDWNDEPNIC